MPQRGKTWVANHAIKTHIVLRKTKNRRQTVLSKHISFMEKQNENGGIDQIITQVPKDSIKRWVRYYLKGDYISSARHLIRGSGGSLGGGRLISGLEV